jgi:DNA-binding NtrC family response regulator
MTAFANIPDAVAAIKLGAYEYVSKPVDADEIGLVVARAVAYVREHGGSAPGSPAPPPEGAPVSLDPSLGFHRAVEEARDRASREYLVAIMKEFGGNVTRAAERAGMERESLHRLLRKYGLRSDDFKEG